MWGQVQEGPGVAPASGDDYSFKPPVTLLVGNRASFPL